MKLIQRIWKMFPQAQSAILRSFAYATQLRVMQPAKLKVIITTNTVKAIFTADANHNI